MVGLGRSQRSRGDSEGAFFRQKGDSAIIERLNKISIKISREAPTHSSDLSDKHSIFLGIILS